MCKEKVEIVTGVRLEEVTDDGIIVSNRDGVKKELKGDNVILAAGLTPNRELFNELSQVPGLDVYAVGDCEEPRIIYDAIHEGHLAADMIK